MSKTMATASSVLVSPDGTPEKRTGRRETSRLSRDSSSSTSGSGQGVFIGARIARRFPVPITDSHDNVIRVVQSIYYGTVTEYCPLNQTQKKKKAKKSEDGLGAGLYRVRYDDGDAEALEPDDIYNGFMLHNDEMERLGRNMSGYVKLVRKIDPRWRRDDENARSSDGMPHQRSQLTEEERDRLDAERLGYWECYRDYNLASGISRPLPLVVAETGQEQTAGETSTSSREVRTSRSVQTAMLKEAVSAAAVAAAAEVPESSSPSSEDGDETVSVESPSPNDEDEDFCADGGRVDTESVASSSASVSTSDSSSGKDMAYMTAEEDEEQDEDESAAKKRSKRKRRDSAGGEGASNKRRRKHATTAAALAIPPAAEAATASNCSNALGRVKKEEDAPDTGSNGVWNRLNIWPFTALGSWSRIEEGFGDICDLT